MTSESKTFIQVTLGVILGIALLLVVFVGPANLVRNFTAWKAHAYGSDWLVVQYNMNGQVLHHWELHNTSIGNEENSDGIYFLDGNNVVHLSGLYTFVQVFGDMEAVKARYLASEGSAALVGAYHHQHEVADGDSDTYVICTDCRDPQWFRAD